MNKIIPVLGILALLIGIATIPIGVSIATNTQKEYQNTKITIETPQEYEWKGIVQISSPIHDITTFDYKGFFRVFKIEDITGNAHWVTISRIIGKTLFDEVYWQTVTIKADLYIGSLHKDSDGRVMLYGYAIGVKITVY